MASAMAYHPRYADKISTFYGVLAVMMGARLFTSMVILIGGGAAVTRRGRRTIRGAVCNALRKTAAELYLPRVAPQSDRDLEPFEAIRIANPHSQCERLVLHAGAACHCK